MRPDHRRVKLKKPVNQEFDRVSKLIEADLKALEKTINRQVEAEIARQSLRGRLARWLGV